MIILKDFQWFSPWKHGCHGNKEGSILNNLISKSYLFMLRRSPEISRKNLFPFQRYLSKTIKEDKKHPPPPPAPGLAGLRNLSYWMSDFYLFIMLQFTHDQWHISKRNSTPRIPWTSQKRLFQMLGQKFLFQEFSVIVNCLSLSTHAHRKFSCYAHKSK